MRVLLLHPEDDFQLSWARQWDLIVDLGRAPKSFYDDWSAKLGCSIFSIYDLALEVEDFREWRNLLRLGLGQVVDRRGIDWWDVIGLLLQPEMQDLRLAKRLANKIGKCDRLDASRHSLVSEALRLQLQCPLNVLHTGVKRRFLATIGRFGRAATNLSFRQLRQVVYDKYDARYIWRRNFAPRPTPSSESVILIPSAYSNVTRTAFRYAQMLPSQKFLLVLARETGEISPVPANVETTSLAIFADSKPDLGELHELENSWEQLATSLGSHPEFHLSAQLAVLSGGHKWLKWGLAVRNAWNAVFERRAVIGCLCADDSNPYTRIPLLLAAQRGLSAVACHHGALDGWMAFKNRAFSTYLVKGEMERDYLERICRVDSIRFETAAPVALSLTPHQGGSVWSDQAPSIVFFTEPYEADLWRAPAVYEEVLPRLCAAAREAGKSVIVKLHPFESARQRRRMVNQILKPDDRRMVTITASPLSQEILAKTWCAVTVESTTAVECAISGIPVFLCGWLRHAYYGYAPQFARFGVARMLESPPDLAKIPEMVASAIPPAGLADCLVSAARAGQLSQILCSPQPSTLR